MAKKLFDYSFSILGLLLLSPMLIIVSIYIKLDSKGPVFFKQTRIGKNENPFQIYKFRTMIQEAERVGKQITVENDPRITRLGLFLRKYKIDEFPQLINVLKGEMSLVGPRPEVPEYVQHYTQAQIKVFTVLPGITDEASIKYKHENHLLSEGINSEEIYIQHIMQDKLKINLKYIDHVSLWLDLKIILRTLLVVFIRKEKGYNETYINQSEDSNESKFLKE
ncbi:sugar transferase [Chengkuizengella sediminis]|uniref:sugar transferase n=1 Tax=Chengkuizengella sediminis TaxID=1885917 RepID=UPI00138A4264|nr:sugar transferase [Chengkuizengella sediminis]NDI34872.1 sugar transferase [Chengkuizengella sediminis]